MLKSKDTYTRYTHTKIHSYIHRYKLAVIDTNKHTFMHASIQIYFAETYIHSNSNMDIDRDRKIKVHGWE